MLKLRGPGSSTVFGVTTSQWSSSRPFAERSPHALERAGVRIEHDDPVIAVSVGDEHFVGGRMHPNVRRAMEVPVSALPLLWLLRPICRTSLPSGVNFST